MEISTGKNREKGNFLTTPTSDCTPGYAAGFEVEFPLNTTEKSMLRVNKSLRACKGLSILLDSQTIQKVQKSRMYPAGKRLPKHGKEDERKIYIKKDFGSPISRGMVLSTKVYSGTCRWNGSQTQPPGITMTPIQCKNWYKHGSYFQNFLQLARKWAQFHQSDTEICLEA